MRTELKYSLAKYEGGRASKETHVPKEEQSQEKLDWENRTAVWKTSLSGIPPTEVELAEINKVKAELEELAEQKVP